MAVSLVMFKRRGWMIRLWPAQQHAECLPHTSSIAQFQPLAFGGLAKNNNTPGQLHKCKLSGRVLRFLSGQTHHHCAQVIPVEDKRRRLNHWLGK